MKATNLIMFLILVASVSATAQLTPKVVLYSPYNNTNSSTTIMEYLFELQGPEDADYCSLIIDDEPVKKYYDVQRLSNRQFTYKTENGEHTWRVDCYVDSMTVRSEEWRIGIHSLGAEDSCVEKTYKGSGTYRFTLTSECAATNPTVGGLRTGDWIEVRMAAISRPEGGRFESKSNYFIIYVVQVTSSNGQDLLRFNTNRDLTKKELFVGESLGLDEDGDGTEDFNITVDDIFQKRVTVSLNYGMPPYEEPVVISEESEVVEEEVIPVVFQDDEEEEIEPEETEENTPPHTDSKGKFWTTIIIIIILAVIVGYIVLSSKKDKKHHVPIPKEKTEFMLDLEGEKPKTIQKEKHKKKRFGRKKS